MKFKGKIAQWWYLAIAFLNGITIALFIVKRMNSVCWSLVPILLILDLYLIPVLFQNYVTIDKKNVIVQFGLLKKTIPTQDIVTVKETNAAYASFCASFDRVEIETSYSSPVSVSVEEKKELIQALLKANRKIKYVIG